MTGKVKRESAVRPGTMRKIGLVILSLVMLLVATLITLSSIDKPRIQAEPIQESLNRLALQDQPQDRRAESAFITLLEAAVMAHEVASVLSSEKADFRDVWSGWGAPPSRRGTATDAYMTLYANGFLERVEEVAEAPAIARNLSVVVFLARGEREDEIAINDLVKAMIGRALLASEERNDDRLVLAVDQAIAIARACALQPRVSNWLLGAHAAQFTLGHVRLLMAHGALSDGAAEKIAHGIRARFPFPPVSRSIEGRRLGTIGVLQDEFGVGIKSVGPQSMLGYLAVRMRRGDFDSLKARINAHFHALIEISAHAYHEIRASGRTLGSLDFAPDDSIAFFVEPPGLPNIILARDRLQAEVDATLLLLAIHRYELKHGKPPQNLAAVAPAFIAPLPVDPFRPDQPFMYKAPSEVSGASSGPRFVLYSVGPDGIDNNANSAPLVPYDAAPADLEGLDLQYVEAQRTTTKEH